MSYCTANGVRLCYEIIEPAQARNAPALLLIMGLGAQLTAWPDALCQDLAARGWRVIRFDNRDAGLSQQLDELPVPALDSMMLKLMTGTPIQPPYELGTWRAMRWACSTRWASRVRMSQEPRWAA